MGPKGGYRGCIHPQPHSAQALRCMCECVTLRLTRLSYILTLHGYLVSYIYMCVPCALWAHGPLPLFSMCSVCLWLCAVYHTVARVRSHYSTQLYL